MSDPVRMEGLEKRYGDFQAVEPLGLTVPKGQICGFLGPNGAGKSTTIKMLVGLARPTGGRALINGHDVVDAPVRARQGLGYLPEVVGLYPDMTGRQLLRYTGRFFGVDASEATRRSEELLAAVDLADGAGRKVRTYSKGMRQRLALASALFHDPQVLVLDEPLTGLDPVGVIRMRDAIKRLGREKTIFLSSHELHAVEALCDRVVIVKSGRVLADAPVTDLTRPAPRYRLELAAPLPGLAARLVDAGVAEEATDTEDGRVVNLLLTSNDGAAAVVEAAVKEGARVTAFAPVSRTLEDAFIEIAGVRRR